MGKVPAANWGQRKTYVLGNAYFNSKFKNKVFEYLKYEFLAAGFLKNLYCMQVPFLETVIASEILNLTREKKKD